MPDIHIQDIPEDILSSLRDLAISTGATEEDWIRNYVITSLRSLNPTPKQSYVLRCKGKQGSYGVISRRYKEPNPQIKSVTVHPRQEEALIKAEELVRRNGIGDRELAMQVLQTAFEQVTEEL